MTTTPYLALHVIWVAKGAGTANSQSGRAATCVKDQLFGRPRPKSFGACQISSTYISVSQTSAK